MMTVDAGSRGRVAWVGCRVIDILMGILLVAGILKSLDLPGFQSAVRTWPFVPDGASFTIALIVTNLEIAIALGWFFGLARKLALGAASLGLVVSIVIFAAYLGASEAPDCGCFGILQTYYGRHDTAEFIVVRNGALLAVLLAGMCMAAGVPNRTGRAATRTCAASGRGFTLLETIISIVLIAILLSLLSPLLNQSRAFARRTVSMSNLRQHAAVFAAYSGDYQDQFPLFVYPDAQAVVRCGGKAIAIDYWSSYARWPYAMASDYYEGDCRHESFHPPGDSASGSTARYYYGCCFIARPEYWNALTRTGPSQWASTRQAEVIYPASKGLLFEFTPLDPKLVSAAERARMAVPVSLVDGHARSVRLGAIRSGYRAGDGMFGGGSHHFSDGPTGLHTLNGVRGRDLQ